MSTARHQVDLSNTSLQRHLIHKEGHPEQTMLQEIRQAKIVLRKYLTIQHQLTEVIQTIDLLRVKQMINMLEMKASVMKGNRL